MTISLCIADIERLAKAGVAISLGYGNGEILPQTDPAPRETIDRYTSLCDAIWDRWRRTKLSMSGHENGFGRSMPFQLLASQHGDTVWVSVHPTNFNYEPFQLQDPSPIFPSDALMARIALWEKHHP